MLLSPLFSLFPSFAASEEPVEVRGDQVEYFDTFQKMVASGNVVATHRDVKLTCDQATIYMATKDAYLKGRVRLAQAGSLLKGEEVVYNFQTRKGTVLQAESEVDPWRSQGDRIQKISESAFQHRDGTLTTCDFEDPHSRLKAKEIRVFLDDRVVLKNAVMYVGKVPLLYLPSYTHPLDDKRPRVTIIPGKDKQWGLFLLTAWRLYLHENLQGRVHVDYRERLDLASGVDLKYELPTGGKGLFRTYYTNQRALQREHAWSKFFNEDKDKPTTEVERFRFQLRHRWEIDPQTQATLEYNRAKDPTMVQDLFLREYERDQSTRTYFQLLKSAPWFGINFLVDKRVNRFETLVQQLPLIEFRTRPFKIPWLWAPKTSGGLLGGGGASPGWYYQSASDYTHSNVANKTNGTEASLLRFNTLQEIFHSSRLFRWLNLRPFASFRHTADSRGLTENAPQFRQAAAAGFDLSTKLSRLFLLDSDLWGIEIHRLRHIITPTLAYKYQAKPTLSADRLLRSDGLAKSNMLTAGLEHKLQTKRGVGKNLQTVDIARFLKSVSYDLEGAGGRGGRVGDLDLDMELLPTAWLRLESDAKIDPHLGKFSTINADLVAGPRGASATVGDLDATQSVGRLGQRPWTTGLGWRYQRNTSSQLVWETEFDLGKKWHVGVYQAFDVKRFVTETSPTESRTVKKIYDFPEVEYRLERDLHEWTVELVYNVRRAQGESVLLLFRLKAFPDMPLETQRSYHQPKSGRNFPKR